jgi:hypothetical protein
MMQRHYVLAALTESAYSAISAQQNMNHAVPMYLASDVDALLARIKTMAEEAVSAWEACDARAGLHEIISLMDSVTK